MISEWINPCFWLVKVTVWQSWAYELQVTGTNVYFSSFTDKTFTKLDFEEHDESLNRSKNCFPFASFSVFFALSLFCVLCPMLAVFLVVHSWLPSNVGSVSGCSFLIVVQCWQCFWLFILDCRPMLAVFLVVHSWLPSNVGSVSGCSFLIVVQCWQCFWLFTHRWKQTQDICGDRKWLHSWT